MSLGLFHDTIAALATPEGRSALAIVRLSGPDAVAITSRIIGEPELLWSARSGATIYTTILSTSPHEQEDVRPVDDVIIHVFRAPRSFTGEDLCEITAHGSQVITHQILSLLIAAGARQAEPGEFSRRAFFNGKIGIEDAELIAIKADSQSEVQLRGSELALHEKFERLRVAYDHLVSLIALVDSEIDFGESDHIAIDNFDERIATVISSLSKLISGSSNRRVNAGYLTVALVGPPNVGKSSIFNAMLQFERSIVSEKPGTTRDYVEAFIDVDGFKVKLIDTAGLREAEENIERRGIELGQTATVHSDIILRVTEPGDRYPKSNGDQLLHNKIDLDTWDTGLRMSARTGEGIEDVHSWLSDRLRERSSEWNLMSLSASEKSILETTVASLSNVNLVMEPAILSEELRIATKGIGQLLGTNIGADSLEHIFLKMCIGK